MSRYLKGQRSVGGGRSSYRHPQEVQRQREIRAANPAADAKERHAARVAAKIAQREREREEGLIP